MIQYFRPNPDWQAVEGCLPICMGRIFIMGFCPKEEGNGKDMRAKKIMIVDDEPVVRDIIKVTLERMDEKFEIVVAKDGAEALNFIMEKSYDLIISDIRMPVLSGLRLATVVRALGEKVEIIWISGYGIHELVDEFNLLEIHSFLDKPVKVGEIRKNVQTALGLSPST